MNKAPETINELHSAISTFQTLFGKIESEIGRVIVGNTEIVRDTLTAFFSGGHVLLEGVPGLGKTLLVKSLAQSLGLNFNRIQFTPDLMPADVTGTQVLTEDELGRRSFVFRRGPLFANIVLADEINRATPKTQSALLEAMEERQITVFGETFLLDPPFFVLATQNPVELEGTYPLPEAQLDRFLMKLLIPAPSSDELKEILNRTTGTLVPEAETVLPATQLISAVADMKQLVRRVLVPEPLQEVLARIISALTPGNRFATKRVEQYVRFGPGPRGAQAIVLAGKTRALLDGRVNLSFEDIKTVIQPCLRHRLVLNFQAEADGVNSDEIISEIRNAR